MTLSAFFPGPQTGVGYRFSSATGWASDRSEANIVHIGSGLYQVTLEIPFNATGIFWDCDNANFKLFEDLTETVSLQQLQNAANPPPVIPPIQSAPALPELPEQRFTTTTVYPGVTPAAPIARPQQVFTEADGSAELDLYVQSKNDPVRAATILVRDLCGHLRFKDTANVYVLRRTNPHNPAEDIFFVKFPARTFLRTSCKIITYIAREERVYFSSMRMETIEGIGDVEESKVCGESNSGAC